MVDGYEINDLVKEESWRMFRIMGEFVEGLEDLAKLGPAVSVFGSARLAKDSKYYKMAETVTAELVRQAPAYPQT